MQGTDKSRKQYTCSWGKMPVGQHCAAHPSTCPPDEKSTDRNCVHFCMKSHNSIVFLQTSPSHCPLFFSSFPHKNRCIPPFSSCIPSQKTYRDQSSKMGIIFSSFQELDSMIFMGPFHFGICCDSMTLF